MTNLMILKFILKLIFNRIRFLAIFKQKSLMIMNKIEIVFISNDFQLTNILMKSLKSQVFRSYV